MRFVSEPEKTQSDQTMKTSAIILSTLLLAASPLPAQTTEKISTEQLIEQLGDPDYEVRKRAEETLLKLGKKALESLEASAEKAEDPEIQWRAGRLIRRIQAGSEERGLSRRQDREPPGLPGRGPGAEVGRRSLQEVMEELDRVFDVEIRGLDENLHRDLERSMAELRKSLGDLEGMRGSFRSEGRGSGRSQSMSIGPDGVRVEITETDADGKKDTKVYEAEDMEAFREKYPGVLGEGGMNFGFRVGGVRIGDGLRMRSLPRLRLEPGTELRRLRIGGEPPVVESEGPKLGFYVGEISPAVRGYLELEPGRGLMVESVAEDTLAEKLELRSGDIVIEVNGRSIGEPADVSAALGEGDGGVTVKIIRRGREVTLGPVKSPAEGAVDEAKPMRLIRRIR